MEVVGEIYFRVWVAGGFMSMEQWWNVTDRGNTEVLGEKHYSVGARWMNGYGAMVK